MFTISLNPGFALILAALAALGTPTRFRPWLMGVSAALALLLLLGREFGAAQAVAQMGLSVVLLDIDALNRVFGIAFLIAMVLIAIYSGARRNRYEDAAILLMAGGAVTALFVGDLVSFAAALALTGLAAAWIVFASPVQGADGAGVRLLVWHGLEGLLLLAGVAFHISSGGANSVFALMSARLLDGGLVLAALMICVGGPLAHVWLKDAISHASSAGAVALSVFPAMLGVYALARLFPAEPMLRMAGLAMMAIGVVYATAEDDFRRAGAYGLTAQLGVCVALVGVGSPLARAGAEAHAFSLIMSFALLQMAFGALLTRHGGVRGVNLGGAVHGQPLTAMFAVLAGLAVAGAPALATFASITVALEATSFWDTRFIWLATGLVSAALMASLALRPCLVIFAERPRPAPVEPGEAPFPMLLAMSLCAFFCIAIGLNPDWLYRLTPAELAFAPYALEHVAPALALVGASAAVYLLLHLLSLTPAVAPVRLLDLDALYRGPVAGAGRWLGVVLLRVLGGAQVGLGKIGARVGAGLRRWTEALDRPYADHWAGAAQWLALAAMILLASLAKH